MVEINLLPEELRAKKAKTGLDAKYLLYILPLLFVLIILLHIYLMAMLVTKSYQFNLLNKTWDGLESDRKKLEGLKKESSMLLKDTKTIEDLVAKRISWAEKLNKLSLELPSGIWFNEVSAGDKELLIKASVISLQKEEINLINTFLDKLKMDSVFYSDFERFELGPMQRKNIGGYEVVDFTVTGKLKQK